MRIELSPEAEADLREIIGRVARDRPGAAIRAATRAEESIQCLGLLPEIGSRGILPETRELFTYEPPYKIVYRIEDDAIFVINIIHASRVWPG